MPHSHPHGKTWAADLFAVTRPVRVTDLGAGAGMWRDAFQGRGRARWVAVEKWEPYVARYRLAERYDDVVVADARDYVAENPPYGPGDLLIAGDVLEHMPQIDAEALLRRCTFGHTLVSVPVIHYEQGALEGNPHEAHLWHPTHEWAMDVLRPDAYTLGEVVGAYWRAPCG